MSHKRIVLVYPPHTTALSPPLGVAMLKGAVDARLPDWSAKVFDQNLSFHDIVLANTDEHMPPARQQDPTFAMTLERATQVFKGGNPKEFYDRTDLYKTYAQVTLEYMSSVSKKHSDRLGRAYRDETAMPQMVHDFVDQILAEEPDALGMSLCYNEQFWFAMCIAKVLGQRSSIPKIFGGTYFLYNAEEILHDFKPAVDYVVTGDGETALTDLLANLDDPTGVPGLCWHEGKQVRTNPPAYEPKLDQLGHPDFSDTPPEDYYSPESVVPILTSRGCYWRRCTFCTHYQTFGLKYRIHSLEYFIDEIRSHLEKGRRHFSIVDEMLAPKRFAQLSDAIAEAKLDIRYYAMARPTKDFTPDRLRKMYESGLRYVMWGVESGSPRILERIEKGTNVPDVEVVLRDSTRAGIFNHTFIFFGFPTESREEAEETVRFLHRNRDHIHQVMRGVFQLDRGSPIYDHPQKFGVRTMKAQGYPNKNLLAFECDEGMPRAEVFEFFDRVVSWMRDFSSIADPMGKLREHGILIYSKNEGKVDLSKRQFGPCPVEDADVRPAAAPVRLEVVDASEVIPSEPAPERAEGPAPTLLTRSVMKLGRGLRAFRKPAVKRNRERYPEYEVIEVPLILTDEQCDHLIEVGRQQFDIRDPETPPSLPTHITRRTAGFVDSDATILEIKKRLASITGAPIERQERLQVARFGLMEFYAPHRDATADPARDTGSGGNREQTVILFLNDDFDGGTIHFPEIGQEVTPEKGKAVVISNLTDDGDPHPLSLYSHDAVLGGERWICSQWIREQALPQAEPAPAQAGNAPQSKVRKRPPAGAKRRAGKGTRKPSKGRKR